MASLEDKILGEVQDNYCSSDEGEHEEDKVFSSRESQEEPSNSKDSTSRPQSTSSQPPPSPGKWGGTSQNTGPKGVLRDWELYKAQEEFIRKAKEQELIQMVKATSLSCRTEAEDQQAKEIIEKLTEEMEASDDIDELLMSDKVLEEFIKKRMGQMVKGQDVKPKFGQGLVDLKTGDDFLKVVDESDPRIPVLIHIYDEKYPECSKMNGCLSDLSELYGQVQFCKIWADAAGVSLNFKAKGIPALLVYKGGNLIGNFVQLREEFGTEFYSGDVENFLIENGMIEDRNNVPALLAAAKKRIKS